LNQSIAAVTVVIPVWDEYVQFLPEAVESARADSPEVSVLVVDNASASEVPSIDGVTVVRSPERLSIGAARNLGIARVETEYLVVLDADDMLLPGALDGLRAELDQDAGVSACVRSIIEGDTGRRHRTPRPFVPALARWRRTFAFLEAGWSLFPTQGCTMLRTAQVRDAGGYADSSWGEDWVLAVSLAFRGRVRIDETPALYYRATAQSLWRSGPVPASKLAASARLVRERLRQDPAVPRWARAMLPLAAGLQLSVIYVLRPLYVAARRIRTGAGRG
jgi:glycosyltransferase involved in cell wall biosynthesis